MKTALKIKGHWTELKIQLKNKFPKLTDEDLIFEPGNERKLVSHLSRKLGKTEDEIADAIDDLQSESTSASQQILP